MTHSTDDYRNQMLALQPPGDALPADVTSTWALLLLALATESARSDDRGDDLTDEADPRASRELLTDWERVAGLPDTCSSAASTLQERRMSLMQKLVSIGGQSVAYFLGIATSLGYAATLTECKPFVCGVSQVGVQPLNPPEMRFVWFVVLVAPRLTYFHMGISQVGFDRLLKISRASDLECLIKRLKPAHTMAFISYIGV